MAALKLMSSTDAKVFTLLCGALFQSRSGRSHLLLDDMADAWLQTQGLSSDDRFYLQSIGLIHGELVLNLSKSGTVALVHFGKPYKLSLAAIHKSPDFLPVLTETLTPVGSELLNVVNATPNQAYLEVLARGLLDQGFILVQDNA
jgi:hypothetical protein